VIKEICAFELTNFGFPFKNKLIPNTRSDEIKHLINYESLVGCLLQCTINNEEHDSYNDMSDTSSFYNELITCDMYCYAWGQPDKYL
jgi:hypothetical protein